MPIETADSIGVFAALIVRQSPERCLFHQHIRIAEGTRIVYLQGLWQDYSIVREVETQLRRELSLAEPLRGGNLEVAKRIAAARNPVSLHLRRGDYGPFFSSSLTMWRLPRIGCEEPRDLLCRHHLIANSTFSWWGAWLNPHCDQQVIAPARWLGFDTTRTAIACPE